MDETSRTKIRRHPERGSFESERIFSILDQAPVATVSFIEDSRPVSIPMLPSRIGATLYLHGSPASRLMTTLAAGSEVCVCATIVDGIVLARSTFNSSLNYRSVVVFGTSAPVDDPDEKMAAMRAVSEHIAPGRWDEVRPPSAKEIAGTMIVSVPIQEASAKVRTGPPIDDEGDLDTVWTGVVPLTTVALTPEPVFANLDAPASVLALRERFRAG